MDSGFQIDFLRIGFLNKVSSSGPTGFNRIWIGFSELELVSSGQAQVFQDRIGRFSGYGYWFHRTGRGFFGQDWLFKG